MATDFCLASIYFIDGGSTTIVIRAKVAEYFGIEGIQPTWQTFKKSSYTYTRYDGIDSTTGKTVQVPSCRFSRSQLSSRKGARTVRVPTESLTPKGHDKTYGITFPQKANYTDISHWLATNCKQHKPRYFLTEAGKKLYVMDFTPFYTGSQAQT